MTPDIRASSSDHAGGLVVVPRQELIDPALRMATDDAGDDVGDVALGSDAVELGGLDERGKDGPVVSAAVGPSEQGVFAGEREGPDGAFDGVVVDLDPAIVEEDGQARPA